MQVYGETDVEVIERDIRRLALGIVGLAIGTGLCYFIAVSNLNYVYGQYWCSKNNTVKVYSFKPLCHVSFIALNCSLCSYSLLILLVRG